MLGVLVASVVLTGAPKTYLSSGECWLGDECYPQVAVTLESQGWGAHIVYTMYLHVADWSAGAHISVLMSGLPSIVSIGHPTGCKIVQSGKSSVTVALNDEPCDLCSAVISTSRVSLLALHRKLIV